MRAHIIQVIVMVPHAYLDHGVNVSLSVGCAWWAAYEASSEQAKHTGMA